MWRLSRQARGRGGALDRLARERAAAHPRARRRRSGREVEAFARERGVWLLFGSIGFGPGEDEYYNSVYAVVAGGAAALALRQGPPGAVRRVRAAGREDRGAARPGPRGRRVHAGHAACCRCRGRPGRSAWRCATRWRTPRCTRARSCAARGVLATITNDGWYGDSAAPRQHLALAILRAAEARRYLVRAANTGISAVIDPYGRVLDPPGRQPRGVDHRRGAARRPGSPLRCASGGAIRARRRASGRRCYHSRGAAPRLAVR